jgi:hypothetical protein
MNFEEYLIGKRIDSLAFKSAEPEVWNEWDGLFEQLSEASFTAQKLYLINGIRRKYLLKLSVGTAVPKASASTTLKPVMKPKPKIN